MLKLMGKKIFTTLLSKNLNLYNYLKKSSCSIDFEMVRYIVQIKMQVSKVNNSWVFGLPLYGDQF